MSRSVILDFLSFYRSELNKNKFKMATISLMGRFNIKEVSNLLLRADEVVTFHVNEPRIYEKTYSFEVFANTIADMIIYTKERIILKKEELTSINDPFYLKDITKIEFKSVLLCPIIKNDEVVGTIILYFDEYVKNMNLKQTDLLRLFDQLQDSQNSYYDSLVKNEIYKSEEFIKVIYLKDMSKCYIDNHLKNKFHLKTNILDLSDKKISKKVEREISNKCYRSVKNDDLLIYYANKTDYFNKTVDFELLALKSITKYISSQFTLIYVKNCDMDELLFTEFPDSTIKKFNIKDDFNLYLINLEITSNKIKEIENTISSDYFMCLSSKVITQKMNLLSLTDYIDECRPVLFKFNDYVSYINTINELNLNSNEFISLNNDLAFVNSLSNNLYCYLPKLINFNIVGEKTRDLYVDSIYKFINNLIKTQTKGYIIPIIPSMFKTNRIFNLLEKVKTYDNDIKVLISVPLVDNIYIDLLEKSISKLKKQGIIVVVDSSIYFNNMTLYLLDLCDSIYLHKEEYEILVKYPSGINTAIFQYIVRNYKEMLINYPLEKVTDAYFNRLMFYTK